MKLRLAASLCACLMMAGCSFLPKFGDLLSFSGSDDADADFPSAPVVAAATPAQTAPGQVDPFCLSVAAQGAQEGGFDQATQQRMAQRDYKQCVTLHGSP